MTTTPAAPADRRIDLSQRLAATARPGTAPGTISGTAVRYGVKVDRGYGLHMVLEPGCFAKQVRDPARVKILWQHDHSEPIGKLTGLTDTREQLGFAGRIADKPELATAQKALALLREEILDEVSVGFLIKKYTREVDNDREEVTYRITHAQLQELSVVTFGALGPDAAVSDVHHDTGGTDLRALEARRMRAQLARLRA